MESLRLALKYMAISIRGQLQYRASFVLLLVSYMLMTGSEIFGVWALFSRFQSLGDWRLPEVALLYSIVTIGFAIANCMARGFDLFADQVRSGEFDRLLLRPRGTAFQVAVSQVQLMRLGAFMQAAVVMAWAIPHLPVAWSAPRVALLAFSIVGVACVFYAVFIIGAAVAFWTIEQVEILNVIIYGARDASQYPIAIFKPWLQRLFIFIVPAGSVTYFPLLAILGRPDSALGSPQWFHWCAPALGVVFLFMSLRFWRLGVRHYHSTGS